MASLPYADISVACGWRILDESIERLERKRLELAPRVTTLRATRHRNHPLAPSPPFVLDARI